MLRRVQREVPARATSHLIAMPGHVPGIGVFAVANGQGIAMLPSYVAANDRELRPVMPELFSMRDIWLSVHEDLLHIARIKAVTAFLEKRIELDKALLTSVRGKGKRS